MRANSTLSQKASAQYWHRRCMGTFFREQAHITKGSAQHWHRRCMGAFFREHAHIIYRCQLNIVNIVGFGYWHLRWFLESTGFHESRFSEAARSNGGLSSPFRALLLVVHTVLFFIVLSARRRSTEEKACPEPNLAKLLLPPLASICTWHHQRLPEIEALPSLHVQYAALDHQSCPHRYRSLDTTGLSPSLHPALVTFVEGVESAYKT